MLMRLVWVETRSTNHHQGRPTSVLSRLLPPCAGSLPLTREHIPGRRRKQQQRPLASHLTAGRPAARPPLCFFRPQRRRDARRDTATRVLPRHLGKSTATPPTSSRAGAVGACSPRPRRSSTAAAAGAATAAAACLWARGVAPPSTARFPAASQCAGGGQVPPARGR